MPNSTPNIIYILADDMGFGDMACNNPNSKIPTPNLDRLASQGMRFTDAHAATAVCTPSRYNILTGRYCWRSRLKSGIVWEWDSPLIEPNRLTVAGLLKQRGYATHCVGKWHLGWDWTTTDGTPASAHLPFGIFTPESRKLRAEMSGRIDYTRRLAGGPVDCGFDTYFGVDVPNFPPYTWFENDRLAEIPTVAKPATMYGHPGLMIPGWSLEQMIPELTRRAVSLIESAQQPFFLYFPLTSPHAPIVPNDAFKGLSNAGKYGDFVCEVDWVVGQVMEALERSGKADNTLLIFTSDNGPEALPLNFEGAYELARTTGHYSMGDWRGTKRDTWEGSHRVPMIARWPAVTPGGTVCPHLVCLGDLFATCAHITGTAGPPNAGEDSISMLPLLHGRLAAPIRDDLVYHSATGRFAFRSKNWVFIDAPTGGDIEEPQWFRLERGYTPHDQPGELFDLTADPAERTNLYTHRTEIVQQFAGLLAKAKLHGARTLPHTAADPHTE